MNKSPRVVAVVELYVLFNFLVLLASLLIIPRLQPTPFSLMVLAAALVLNIVIALGYGVFVIQYQPPLGKRMLSLLRSPVLPTAKPDKSTLF